MYVPDSPRDGDAQIDTEALLDGQQQSQQVTDQLLNGGLRVDVERARHR